jgi:hypothetical protein
MKDMFKKYKEKEDLLMNLILTTVKHSRHKMSEQIYEKFISLFGFTQIDYRIKEMIQFQKRQDLMLEKQETKDDKEDN